MDAVEFLNADEKMCNGGDCANCPIAELKSTFKMACFEIRKKYPKEYVAIVEQWTKDRTTKTYLQDFLERFPKVAENDMEESLCCSICRNDLYHDGRCDYEFNNITCVDCWNESMREVK